MSLYQYGKSASQMPLLQFLAYYQVVEFYFPVYSEVEAQKTLRHVLKDPTFDPMRDADIVRLLKAIKISAGGRSLGDEASQLKATILHCVTANDLRDFFLEERDEGRYKFYTSDKSKKLVREGIPVRKDSDDHRESVAKRVYAIRNRIVHTKSGYDEEPLFPFDPEIKYLQYDIELVKLLAQKVLIASSRSLHV